MTFETKDNSGALFKNEDKEGNQPDYRGQVLVNGKAMEIAAWIKTAKNGKKFMSLSFKEPFKNGSAKPQGKPVADDFDDLNDAPF